MEINRFGNNSIKRSSPLASWFMNIAAVLALVLLSAMAHATTVVKKTFDDLLKESDAIVLGTVSDVASQYVGEKKDIVTHVTLSNLTVLHGALAASTLVLRQEGGDVQGDVVHIEGSPVFSKGDRVIVFIKGNGTEMIPFVGWTQGVFRVFQDSATKKERITDHEGNHVTGIKDNDFVRDVVKAPEARIMSKDGKLSSETQADGGKSDDRNPVSARFGRVALPSEAMAVQDFLGAIQKGVKDRALKGKTITSADPSTASARPPHKVDAPARDSK